MTKFALLLIACAALVQASLALKCKTCQAGACDTLEDKTCPAPPNGQEAACLTYVFTDASKKQQTEKKCVNQAKDKKFDCIKQPNEEVIKCETCKEDFCNSSASTAGLSALAFGIVVALVVPKVI